MRYRRYAWSVCAALALLLRGAGPSWAQGATGSISGTVVEAGTLRPLAGAQVFIPGSGRGALTGATGEYVLTGVPTGAQTVRAQMLGFKETDRAVTVAAGQTATADFQLSASAISLNQIVVTGTPGAVEKRTLGNTVTTIDAAAVADKTANSTVVELLAAKAPGMTITGGSGETGTAHSIKIRGVTSLAAGNQPVIYVDGIKVYNGTLGNFAPNCCADQSTAQRTDALAGINPEDIESIEVIKGPAAATLYGADAAAGVIQIITKKGKPGQQQLQWNAKVQLGGNSWAVRQPVNYTLCDDAKVANATGWPGCQGAAPGTMLSQNVMTYDPNEIRTGAIQNYTLSARGGGDSYSFYVAGDYDDENGIFYNNYDNRRSVRTNFAFNPTHVLDFTVNFGYTQQHVALPKNDNDANGIMFNSMLFAPGKANPWGNGLQPDTANMYDNQTTATQLVVGTTANYRPFDWFRNRLTVGYNQVVSEANIFYAPGRVATRLAADPTGYVAQQIPRNQLYTVDYAGTISNALSSSLRSDFSFGMQLLANRYHYLFADGTGLACGCTSLVTSAAKTTGSESFSESNSLGFFGQEQIGVNDRLFLTAGVRMDNNSVFGTDVKRVFYPKLAASYVVSDEPWFHIGHVDNLRLRAAWGQAGKAPEPYTATRTYNSSVATLGTPGSPTSVSAIQYNSYGNPELEAERSTEIEAGFDASFFGNRAGIEATYYNKRTKNGLLSIPVAPSTGFSGTYYANVLDMKNHGFELALTATPVQKRNFAWDARLNLSTNANEMVSFGNPAIHLLTAGPYLPSQRVQPGYPIYGFWKINPKLDASGKPILPIQRGDTTYAGPSTPTRLVGFSNTITLFKNISVFGLLDYQGGFYQFNVRQWRRYRANLVPEVLDPNADPAQVALWQSTFVNSPFIQPGDFLKLRDLSITYNLPRWLTERVRSDRASLTLAAHNVGILWTRYGGLDPEANFDGADDFLRNDAWTAPQSRRVTATLNVSF